MMKLVLLLAAGQLVFTMAADQATRSPKLFFITSSTSTTVSTSTSVLGTHLTCIQLMTKDALTACTGRKRKRAIRELLDDGSELPIDLQVSRVERSAVDTADLEDNVDASHSNEKAVAGNREAKFAWYYMTSTITSTSTAISTSTSFSSTLTISISVGCTPSSFVGCG